MENGELLHKVIGSYIQMPIIPAYAITIHKAQGLTIKKMHLDLTFRCFIAGQLYTSLSRVPCMENLSLEVPVSKKDIKVHRTALNFYDGWYS
jgi:hypothetical protein